MNEKKCMIKRGVAGPVSRPMKLFLKWTRNYDLMVDWRLAPWLMIFLILDAPLSTQLSWTSQIVCKVVTENAYRQAQREKNIEWTIVFGPLRTRWFVFSHFYRKRDTNVLHQAKNKTTISIEATLNFPKTEKGLANSVHELKNYDYHFLERK